MAYTEIEDSALGDGTYGYVVAVEDESGERWAMKVFEVDSSESESESTEEYSCTSGTLATEMDIGVLREISALHALAGHGHVVQVHDVLYHYGEHNLPAMVMKCYDYDLKHAIKNNLVKDTVGVAYDIVDSLRFMHTNGFVHRDIKPSNFLVGSRVVLADFSCAKVYDTSTRAPCHTRSVGSESYRAPEIVDGRHYGFSADCWSLGVVLAELFLGCLNDEERDVEVYANISEKMAKLGEAERALVAPLVRIKHEKRTCADDAIKSPIFGRNYEPMERMVRKHTLKDVAKVDRKFKKAARALEAETPMTAYAAQVYNKASKEQVRYCVMLAYKMYERHKLDTEDACHKFDICDASDYTQAEQRILKAMNNDLFV